jgi:hypothetical protein
MGLHDKTITKLEDKSLCERVIHAVNSRYNKNYIIRTYDVTRRELERIIEFYERKNN